MAAPYNPPKKGEDFLFRIALEDFAQTGTLKHNPTIAAGDFRIDIDGGGYNNLTTLPTVSPTSGSPRPAVLVSLSAAEMTGDIITIVGVDATSPKEWCDFFLCILTTA